MSAPAYPAFDGTQVCAQTDPEAYFPENGISTKAVQRLCGSCPFLTPCLEYALHWAVRGVWGGTSEHQRKAIRAERGIVAQTLEISPLDLLADELRGLAAAGYEAWEIAIRAGVSDRTAERHVRLWRESRGAA